MRHTFTLSPTLFLPFALLMLMIPGNGWCAVESNVIIPEANSTMVLYADKSGKRVTRIKHSTTMTFRAQRVDDKALAFVFYDPTRTIDKAKSKGVRPIYTKATSAGIFFDDSRVCLLPIELKAGKDAEATFETTFNRPDLGALTFLGSIYPVERHTFTYRMPASLRGVIDIVGRNLPSSVNIDRQVSNDGKEYIITVTATKLKAMKEEKSAPASRHISPYVQLTGLYENVDSLYRSLHSYTLREDTDSATVIAKTNEIISGQEDTGAKISAIQDWVHENIRYVAIEHGDLGNAPDIPSEVLRKRFGDCKGSAALIKAMLKAAGIDGRLVWIGTDDIPEDWTDSPLFSTGNHMIAAAMLPDSILYIDGTVGMADCGLYHPGIQGKQTLIENGDSPIIGRVPLLPPEVNTDSVHIAYTFSDTNLNGQMTKTVTGVYKSSLLNTIKDSDASRRDKFLQTYLREGRKGVDVTDFNLENPKPGGGPSVITANIVQNRAVTKAGGKHYLALDIWPGVSAMPVTLDGRTQPLRLRSCNVIKRTVSVTIPAGFVVNQLPSDLIIDNERLKATLNYRLQGRELTADMSLTVKLRDIPFEKLPDYNTESLAFAKALSQRIILETEQ